jgi:hypothetical protein
MQGIPLFTWVNHIDLIELKVLNGNVDRAGHERCIGAFELETVSVALPKKKQIQFCTPLSGPEIGAALARDRQDLFQGYSFYCHQKT